MLSRSRLSRLAFLLVVVVAACGGGGDDEASEPDRTTTTESEATHDEAVDALNDICVGANATISALPEPDPNDQAEFKKNFDEIVRINRAALAEMKQVAHPAEDEEALADALQKQERAIEGLEELGRSVEAQRPTTEEEQASVRSLLDEAADALTAYGAEDCGRP